MSHDNMSRLTLEMLYRLEDFEKAVLKADSELRAEAPPESSRMTKAHTKRIELGNMRGCIAALQSSIRIYRGSGSTQRVKAG